ncbi:hypothetical protein D3C80_1798360 [compost metagenome]
MEEVVRIELVKYLTIMTTAKSIVLNGYLRFQMGLGIAKVAALDHRINVIFQIILPWITGIGVFIDSFE